MKSAFWRSIAVVALVAVPMMANANDATIGSSVANNAMSDATLMNTTSIFNAFPHLVVGNGTGVELNTMGDGQGRVWWEAYDELWINLNVGRMEEGLAGSHFMWGSGFPGAPFQDVFGEYSWINVGIAKPTSGGGGWAVGVNLAPFGSDEETGGAAEFENSFTGYGFNGSWGNGDGLLLGGEIAFTSEEEMNITADTTDEYSSFAFGVNARFDTDTYIYQANIFMNNGEDTGDGFPEDDKDSDFGALINAGRYLKNEIDGQATAEFGLGYLSEKNEVGDVEDTETEFIFPAVRVSAWEKIGNYFGLMGGLSWGYRFQSDENTATDPAIEETDSGSDYSWSAGLFFQPTDNVRIDARFQEGNLNNVLSMGNDEELVLYLGTTVGLN